MSSDSEETIFPVVVDWAGEGDAATVTFGDHGVVGVRYLERQPGVFVSDNVVTEFDFALPFGYFTVASLSGADYEYDGESLDLAFLAASLGRSGVFSADVNADGSLSSVYGREIKLPALASYGLQPTFAKFAD